MKGEYRVTCINCEYKQIPIPNECIGCVGVRSLEFIRKEESIELILSRKIKVGESNG